VDAAGLALSLDLRVVAFTIVVSLGTECFRPRPPAIGEKAR
jgi:hypothetical protein